MSQRQLGLLLLQQGLNFLPGSCGSPKLIFALSINFTSSPKRWQNEPVDGSCTSHPRLAPEKRGSNWVGRESKIWTQL